MWRYIFCCLPFAGACLGQAPSLSSVVNAASFAPGALAAGSAATIFGSNLALSPASPTAYPLPRELGNAKVYVNGIAAPLTYVGSGQINFQIPWEITPAAGSVVVIANGVASNQLSVQIATAAPGIFAGWVYSSAYGPGSAVALHAGEYLTILATGLGAVDQPPATGTSLADAAITKVLAPLTATVGGVSARVAFAGLAPPGPNPYSVGLYQVIVQVPTGIAGASAAVALNAAGAPSNAVSIPVASGSAPTIARYLELGPSSALVARAITSQDTCPAIAVGGKAQTMQVRAAASLPFYPVLSCESSIPASALTVTIDGQGLQLPVLNPVRITVVGDTGCRMDASNSQACYVPAAWPVAAIAASAIATNPQLLIHNGDYHYRENQCFPSVAGCQGSPWGYNWDVWREDLFKPFSGLLATAPWIFVRGNHETCDRAGEGYFRFLDPRPFQATCQTYTDPYAVSTGALQLIHLDSAVADDAVLYPDQIAAYMPQFDTVRQMAAQAPHSWILTHRPIWAIRSNLNSNVVMQAASNNDLGSVQAILSGHTHTFQTYTFSPARAPQIIIGNSGDNLAALSAIPLVGAQVGNATVIAASSIGGFGFSTINPAFGGAWTVTSLDSTGQPTSTCLFQGATISCNQ